MSISLTATYTAIAAGLTSSFLASGGSAPYAYSVDAGGAGGTIDPLTGVYTAPAVASSSPKHTFDSVTVTDGVGDSASAQIMVGLPIQLFCEIIQRGLGLDSGRVRLWDQKIFEPTDYDVSVAVSIPVATPFANITQFIDDGAGNLNEQQSVNMHAMVDIDIISRGPAARDRKEEVLMALSSTYAEQQMEKNSFGIGRISTNFINLSQIDGAAIPYRYKISCGFQYTVAKTIAAPIFTDFNYPTIVVDN